MAYNPLNPNGQAAMANSQPVVIASNQSPVSVAGTVGSSVIGLPPVNLFVGGAAVTTSNAVPVQPPASGTLPVVVPGSVIGVQQGSVAVAIVSGSIAATFTPPTNQSVSGTTGSSVIGTVPVTMAGAWTQSVVGTVSVGNFPTTQNVSGSVVATQGTNPWIITGSVQGSFSPAANQSVSGTVQTDVRGSVAVAIISGSIAATFTPPANQSVSGRVETTQTGTVITSLVSTVPSSVIVGTSIFGQLPGGTAVLGSVATLQGTNPWIITGSVQGSFSPTGNQSVSGTVGASVIGTAPVTQSGVWSVSVVGATVQGQAAPGASVIGNPVYVGGKDPNGSVIAAKFGAGNELIITGSVQASLTPAANQSVSGTVGASIIGTVPVTQVTSPWTVVSSVTGGIFPISGSVAAVVTNTNLNISGSVAAWLNSSNASVITVGSPVANQSVSGTVGASIIGLPPVKLSDGTDILDFYEENQVDASVVGIAQMFKSNVSSSILSVVSPSTPLPVVGSISGTTGSSIIGQLPAGTAVLGSVATLQGTNPWIIQPTSGSVIATQGGTWSTSVMTNVITSIATAGQVMGSVATLQGTMPWTIGSIYGNISGSVAAFIVGNSSVITIQQAPSIVGTYAEDAASAGGDKGILTLGVRNDAVASLVGADLDYTAWATDSAGRQLYKPFAADENRLDTVSSVVSTSVTALFTSVVGLRNYVTDIMVANTGSVATLVTFKDGSTSILGFTIAPAGGGSNINGMAFPLRTAPAQDFTYTAGTASSVLYVTAKGYKAP